MTDHSSTSTNGIESPTQSRRRTLGAVGGLLTVGLAGCLNDSNATDSNTTGPGSTQTDSSPAAFDSIDVGKYTLTVTLANPDELRSVALTRPTSGTIANKQATDTELKFELLGDFRDYNPGEFVLEARKNEDDVVAEHAFRLEPQLSVTDVELLKDADREKLAPMEDEGYVCANQPFVRLFSVTNTGSGPAVCGKIKAPLPDKIDFERVLSAMSPRCHSRGKKPTGWTGDPVLSPGETLVFAPFDELGSGFRSQEPGTSYAVQVGVFEELTGEWRSRDATLEFVDVGDGNRYPIYRLPDEGAE